MCIYIYVCVYIYIYFRAVIYVFFDLTLFFPFISGTLTYRNTQKNNVCEYMYKFVIEKT